MLLKDFLEPNFRFFNLRVFHNRGLSIYPIIIRPVFIQNLGVYIMDKNNRQKTCACFDINRFLDFFNLTI